MRIVEWGLRSSAEDGGECGVGWRELANKFITGAKLYRRTVDEIVIRFITSRLKIVREYRNTRTDPEGT